MTKFIKTQDGFRVRIKYNKTFKEYNLRLQERFFCFWVDTNFGVDVSEGFRGEEDYPENPMKSSSILGGRLERYKTGTIDLKERAKKLCDDYLKQQSEYLRNEKVLADL